MPRNLESTNAHFHAALARVIAEQVEFPMGTLVTLVEAHLTPDSKHATGTLSVLPTGNEAEALRALRDYEHDVKDALAKELRMRRIPHLHWRFDRTEEEAAVIEKELHELKKKGEI